ncbi:MAG: hypothetical protein R3B93_17290 [Bacteroidia bacterium]
MSNQRKIKVFLSLWLAIIVNYTLQGKQIYVAPDGDDTNTGIITSPFWSVQKAQSVASPGDTVYLRGGTYQISASDVSKVESNLFACVSFLDKSGTNGNMIKYWAYPNEQPIFDFSDLKPANQRVVGFWVSGDYIHLRGIEITGVQITITTHTESYCVYSWGDHNIFERIRCMIIKGRASDTETEGITFFSIAMLIIITMMFPRIKKEEMWMDLVVIPKPEA